MHSLSSGSSIDNDTNTTTTATAILGNPAVSVPGYPKRDPHATNIDDSLIPARPQVARKGSSFDLRSDISTVTPRSRNSTMWKSLSMHSSPGNLNSSGSNSGSNNGNDEGDPVSKPSTMSPWASPSLSIQGSTEGSKRNPRLRSPWHCSILIAFTTFLAVIFLLSILYSFATRSAGSNGCGVPMMSPTFIRMVGFDTEHTRFASKYNLFLYREEGVDQYNQENIGVCFRTYIPFTPTLFVSQLVANAASRFCLSS